MNTPMEIGNSPVYERVAAGIMLSMVVCLILTPATIRMGAFRFMLEAGLSWGPVLVIFLVFGTLRFAALAANGGWKYGGHLRALCCGVAAIMWAQMAWALLLLTQETGTYSLGIPTYFGLTILEVVACRRLAIRIHNSRRGGVVSNASSSGSQRVR